MIETTSLLTDLYELTMAYSYWKEGLSSMEAVFHLFFRKKPFGGSLSVAAGLETALQLLEKFQFSSSDLSYLATLQGNGGKPLFEKKFLDELANFKLTCDIDAVCEGSVIFPYEPLVRVTGPILQAQLLESLLLSVINFQTLIATKASRICLAASPDPVVEFGLRRAQGIDGAISAARAAFIGGCSSTSNVLAGKLFGIPVKGTHAHSWIMAFPTEEESFEAWGRCMPHNLVFLLDTYDSIRAAHRVVKIAQKLKLSTFAVRLDSGDLANLSQAVRKILDKAGFKKAQIMASNELDETVIMDLKRQGACIDLWGVGTHLVTGQSQPALDGVYKLSAIRSSSSKPWIYKVKKSEQIAKTTDPGILQVRRFSDDKGFVGDVIYNIAEPLPTEWEGISSLNPAQSHNYLSSMKSEDLLMPVLRQGKRVAAPPSLLQSRQHAISQLGHLPPSIRRFLNPESYTAGLEKSLYDLKLKLLQEVM
jgi:nicotinate phosphoribosyltransferase